MNYSGSYRYSFLQFFGVTALWVLYLSQKGFSPIQIGIMEGIFHVTSFIAEVPSGGAADRFGYKKILALGRVASIISALLIIATNNFYLCCIGFVFSALSYNLASGTSEALIFESLKALKKEKLYLKVSANLGAILEISQAGGIVVAGLLSSWFFDGTYLIQIAIDILAIIVIVQMAEPPHEPVEKQNYIQLVVTAFKVTKSLPGLAVTMISFAFLDALNATYYLYFQNYFAVIGIKGLGISVIVVVSLVFQVLSAKSAPAIGEKFSVRQIYGVITLLLAICIGAAGYLPVALVIAGYIVVNAIQSLADPIRSNMINQMIPSEQRATINSIDSLCYSAMMIPVFPLAGALIEGKGFAITFLILGIITLVGGIFSFRKLKTRPAKG